MPWAKFLYTRTPGVSLVDVRGRLDPSLPVPGISQRTKPRVSHVDKGSAGWGPDARD